MRHARSFKKLAANGRFGVPSARQDRRMLRTNDQQGLGRRHATGKSSYHGEGKGLKEAFRRLARHIDSAIHAAAAENTDRVRLARQTALYVKRLPRIRRLVFSNAKRVFRRLTQSGLVVDAGRRAPDVAQHEPQRSAYRRIGAPTLSQDVARIIDL